MNRVELLEVANGGHSGLSELVGVGRSALGDRSAHRLSEIDHRVIVGGGSHRLVEF